MGALPTARTISPSAICGKLGHLFRRFNVASSRRKVLIGGISAGLFSSLAHGWRALGASRQRFSADADNVAIRGYDTVAYFTDGKATQGSPNFEFEWQGARGRFASAAPRGL